MSAYHLTMDSRMFDYQVFYRDIAIALPNNSNLVEVGVADGASAIYLAEKLLEMGKKFTLHLVDSLDYGGKEQLVTIMSHVCRAGLIDCVKVLPKGSLDASCHFPDQLLDFVFIDASHKYEPTKADIRLWWQKVKDGGTLAGHDYNPNDGLEVKQAVDEVIPAKPLKIIMTEKCCGVWAVKKHHSITLR